MNPEQFIERAISEIDDEGIFSPDQISSLTRMIYSISNALLATSNNIRGSL